MCIHRNVPFIQTKALSLALPRSLTLFRSFACSLVLSLSHTGHVHTSFGGHSATFPPLGSIYMCLLVCLSVCVSCVHSHTHEHAHAHAHAHMHTHTHTHTNTHTHTHTHTQNAHTHAQRRDRSGGGYHVYRALHGPPEHSRQFPPSASGCGVLLFSFLFSPPFCHHEEKDTANNT